MIIPVYNRAHLITKAINSVIQQNYSNWEIILVDYCSTDNIKEVISNFKDERIRFYELPVNKGNAGARNEGVRRSKGDYIFFLDSDDEMEVKCLKLFSELINSKPRTKFAFGGYYILNTETGRKTTKMWKPDSEKSFLRSIK